MPLPHWNTTADRESELHSKSMLTGHPLRKSDSARDTRACADSACLQSCIVPTTYVEFTCSVLEANTLPPLKDGQPQGPFEPASICKACTQSPGSQRSDFSVHRDRTGTMELCCNANVISGMI